MSDAVNFQVTFFIKYAHILRCITRILLLTQFPEGNENICKRNPNRLMLVILCKN